VVGGIAAIGDKAIQLTLICRAECHLCSVKFILEWVVLLEGLQAVLVELGIIDQPVSVAKAGVSQQTRLQSR